mmetsp:Transcript_9168/g.28667  ORF Transcript_9168/g.28667 Transcript_9168/m.28667 type:complete len:393 (-) Transcript_9168:102-1280(-)
MIRPSDAAGPLPPAISARLQGAINSGLLPVPLDPKILTDLGQLPEHMATVVIERFLASNLLSIRNPSAFLVGVMNRYKGELHAGTSPGGASVVAAFSPMPVTADSSVGFAPAPPPPAFGGFPETAVLMGATGVTSTGMPQNANPLLAPSKTIHVGNLSPGVSPAVLRQIFECIGAVVDVRVAGDGRYGFVDFSEADAANAAVAMHGTIVCGTAIRVEKAMQPRLFAQSNQPTPIPPAGVHDPAAALLAFQATQASALQKPTIPEFTGLAGVTSPAVLAALAKQVRGADTPVTVPSDPAFAFMNPAQQRAALEAKHRERLASSKNISGWGVAKRREETSSSDSDSASSGHRRRRRRRDRRRSRSHSRARRNRHRRHTHRDYSPPRTSGGVASD